MSDDAKAEAVVAEMDAANERMGAEIVRLRARLAEVEARCADLAAGGSEAASPDAVSLARLVLAAARGEDDRPACRHDRMASGDSQGRFKCHDCGFELAGRSREGDRPLDVEKERF